MWSLQRGRLDHGTGMVHQEQIGGSMHVRGVLLANGAANRIKHNRYAGHVDSPWRWSASPSRPYWALPCSTSSVSLCGAPRGEKPLWRQAHRNDVPRMCFINKRPHRGNSMRAVASIRTRSAPTRLCVQLPIGAGVRTSRAWSPGAGIGVVSSTPTTSAPPTPTEIPPRWRSWLPRPSHAARGLRPTSTHDLMTKVIHPGYRLPRLMRHELLRAVFARHRRYQALSFLSLAGSGA